MYDVPLLAFTHSFGELKIWNSVVYIPLFFLLPRDKAEIAPRWIMYFFFLRALPLIATRTVSRTCLRLQFCKASFHVAQLRGELRRNFCLPYSAPRWLCIILNVWLPSSKRLRSKDSLSQHAPVAIAPIISPAEIYKFSRITAILRYVRSAKLQRYVWTCVIPPGGIYKSRDYFCNLLHIVDSFEANRTKVALTFRDAISHVKSSHWAYLASL